MKIGLAFPQEYYIDLMDSVARANKISETSNLVLLHDDDKVTSIWVDKKKKVNIPAKQAKVLSVEQTQLNT